MNNYNDPKLLATVVNSYNRVIRVAPKKTGRLAYHAVKFDLQDRVYRIYIDVQISPYMRYTEFRNRTRGWFRQTATEIIKEIAAIMGGHLSKK